MYIKFKKGGENLGLILYIGVMTLIIVEKLEYRGATAPSELLTLLKETASSYASKIPADDG